MPELKHIPLGLIDAPELAMRAEMSEEGLADLVESMRELGLQQPINVRVRSDRYQIISGHRRFLAAQQLAWDKIMSLVWDTDERTSYAQMLAENSVREDVNAAEEALWYAQLMDKFHLDEPGLLALVKRSPNYVAERWKLLRGDGNVFNALRGRHITLAVARELNKCKVPEQLNVFLNLATQGGHNSRTVAKWVSDANLSSGASAPAPPAVETQPSVGADEIPRVECWLCGGGKDPGNLKMIYVHTWCKAHTEKLMAQTPQQESA